MARINDYSPYEVTQVQSFAYGLNDQIEASAILDTELADVENMYIDESAVTTAPGHASWDASPLPGPYWGGFSFKKADGSLVNIRQRQNVLEYAEDGSTTWHTCSLPTSGSPATTVSLTQCQPSFAALNDICIFTNGVDTVMSSADGKTWTLRPTLPISKVVFENAKNRILFLNQTGTGRQFRFDWSAINDPLTIGADSYELIDPNNYGNVLGAGLTPDGTTIVFKEGAAYQVADFVDDGIIDINFIAAVRLTNHHTIQTTNDSIIFHTVDGLYEYIGGAMRPISGRIRTDGRNAVTRSDLYSSAYFNNRYRLSIPDATVSQNYNAQEYIVHKKMPRNDTVQPYAITRNRRYYGCYFVEDSVIDSERQVRLFSGDSRPATTSGSPATYINTFFGIINDLRDPTYDGLNGENQDFFFVTKFFTKNLPFYSKKFKKFFTQLAQNQTETINVSYRFVPYGAWVDTSEESVAQLLEFLEGYGFTEGYGFAQDTLGSMFIDINNPEKPRGIQFKVGGSSSKDVSFLSVAFTSITKPKFK